MQQAPIELYGVPSSASILFSIENMRQRVKYNDYYPLGTPSVDSVVFIMAGKIIDWENMVEFLKIRQFIPVT